ncbi:hypothetical protein KP509_1Z168500 [Ceratopteris richardii]|nr:hypothetical protein KP509_1Z168500 [Ceratopteris richardii]
MKQIHSEETEQIQDLILQVKRMFQKMDLGEISVSAYDTAWIAMVPSLRDPQIPQNQLPDGSWGDDKVFLAFERLSTTLACVVALKTWNRRIDFILRNIERLGNEDEEQMTVGFEVIFPALLEDARLLGLDLPYDSPYVQKVIGEREKKLNINKLQNIKLQSTNGSFECSTSSTACALKYTRDKRCLEYLNFVLENFLDAVPITYSLDLFERLWMVDRLERLGISRYFKKEIKDALNYVYKCWTDNGIAWTKDSNIPDADCTSMAFRLLRLHGYSVSPGGIPRKLRHVQKNIKIVFNGLYSTINMIGKKALEHQGHDFTSYIRERQYMLVAKASNGIDAAIQITSFFLGAKISAEWFVDPDYVSLMNSVSTISRINNDIHGYERESGQGKLSCMTLFMKENAIKDHMNAVVHFTSLKDTEMKKLTEKVLKQSKFPKRFISFHMDAIRVMKFIYSKGDGYTSPDVTHDHVKNTLFLPIS